MTKLGNGIKKNLFKNKLRYDVMTDETRCPKCQSTDRAEILWGLANKKVIKEELKRKEIVLGGCYVTEHDPKWQCNECRTRWGRSDSSKKLEKRIEKRDEEDGKPSVPATNLKSQLKKPMMKKIQEIISKAIENKMELKIDDDLETNIENCTISHDDFLEYQDLVSSILSFSGMTLSKSDMNDYYSSLEKCDFTKEDFFYYLTLENHIWKVLDENVLDKELVSDFHFYRLENDFDDLMTDNRKKVFELNLDQTEVWKELEPRIEKGIGNMGYLEKVKNWNKSLKKKKEEVKFSKEYRELFGDEDGIPSVPETKKVEEIPARIWLKRELASAIGITICSKCGTRTKMIKTHLDPDFPSAGYATCPKCGRKEKWRVGE